MQCVGKRVPRNQVQQQVNVRLSFTTALLTLTSTSFQRKISLFFVIRTPFRLSAFRLHESHIPKQPQDRDTQTKALCTLQFFYII